MNVNGKKAKSDVEFNVRELLNNNELKIDELEKIWKLILINQ